MDKLSFQLFVGLCLGVLIGLLARRARALTRGGAWAAALTGGLIFGLGGLDWAILLLAFFISSSTWSRSFASRKTALAEKYAKGSQRDWGQVLANGGLGVLLVVASALSAQAAWTWVAYAGALAAVNADTWATELGVFSPSPPRLITTGRDVERGTSGGVTPLGYLAALGGSGLIAGLAGLLRPTVYPAVAILIGALTLAGLVGTTVDSILGASVQAIYYCPQCQKETERHPLHTCGTSTTLMRGYYWLDNDLVNFICSAVGAIAALGLWAILA